MSFKKGYIPWNKGKKASDEHRQNISNALKGKPRPEEVREKISRSSMGKRGTFGHLNKPHTIEARQKMSAAKLGKPSWNKGKTAENDPRLRFERPTIFQKGHDKGSRFGRDRDCSGPNHYNWKDGKSLEPYGPNWTNTLKEAIRQRDEYKCQVCFRTQAELSQRLSVHHINEIKTDMRPENLVSVCRGCHARIHRGTVSLFRKAG